MGSLFVSSSHVCRSMIDLPTTFGIGVRMREKRRSWIILFGVLSERRPSSPPGRLVRRLMEMRWGVPNRP